MKEEKNGIPPQGQGESSPQGHPPQGHPPQGHPPQGHPPQGHPPQGHPPQGHSPQGHPPQGHPPQGHPPQGHPHQGHPPQGHPPQGHPPQGHPPQGHPPQEGNQRPQEGGIRPMGMGGPPGMNGPRGARPKLKNTKETILRVWSYLSESKGKVILALVCVLLNTALSLLASYQVRPILNGIVAGDGMEPFLRGVLLMLILYVTAVTANFFQSKIMLTMSQKALEAIRNQLFEKLQKLPVSYYDGNNNGEMMSRFTNDVDTINQMLTQTLTQLVSGIVTLVGTFCIMVYTNIWLTLITLVMIPVISQVGKFVATRSRKFYQGQQESIGEMNGFIEEMVSGQKVVKVFNHQEENREKFKVLNQNYRDKVFKAQFVGGVMGPIMGSLANLNYGITAVVGGLLCVFQGFDVGGYTIFVNYSRNFSRPISEITMQMNVIFAALAGAERVFEMMDQEPESPDKENAVSSATLEGNIEITDMDFGYLPDKLVLKNISFQAKSSEKIAFVGSTGAGKTTITNLLNRFYEIQKGVITIDGVNIQDMKRDYLRENIALVLQDTHLFTPRVCNYW